MAALFRRNVRAAVFLLVRLVAVGILLALLEATSPWVRQNRGFVDAGASVLVVWPFYTVVGRNAAWRIALGRSYVREARWAEAEQALAVFARFYAVPFDAAGEGAYWLGVTLRALDREQAARRLLLSVARGRRGSWQEKAEAALAERAVSP